MNQNDGRDIILEIGQVISGVLMAVDSLWSCVAPSGSCPTSSGLCLINKKMGKDNGMANIPIILYATLHE